MPLLGTPYTACASSTAAGSGTFQVTVTTSVAQGDTVVVVISGNSTGALPTGVTDVHGNTYTQALLDTTRQPSLGIYVGVAQTALIGTDRSGTDWIQGSWSGTAGVKELVARGCSGVQAVSAVDQSAHADSGTGTSPSSGATGALAQRREWAVAAIANGAGGGTPTSWTGGFTAVTTQGTGPFLTVADQVVDSTAALTAGATITNATWTCGVVTLRGAPAPRTQIFTSPRQPPRYGALLTPLVAPATSAGPPAELPVFPNVPLDVRAEIFLGSAATAGPPPVTIPPALVGSTQPNQCISNAGAYYFGLTKKQADAAFCSAVGRSGNNGYPQVTKLFWNAPGDGNQWTVSSSPTGWNALPHYIAERIYVIACVQPAFVAGSTSGPHGGNGTSADLANLTTWLSQMGTLGFTGANMEVVLWQEPSNTGKGLSAADYGAMLKSYGPAVIAAGFPLTMSLNFAGTLRPVPDNAVAYALAGLATGLGFHAIGLDYYTNHFATPIDAIGSSGFSITSLADANGLNFRLHEWGTDPSSFSMSTCLDFMGYLETFFVARQLAGVGPQVFIHYDGQGSPTGAGDITAPLLSSADRARFGLSPATDPRISAVPLPAAGYQQLFDALTAPTVTVPQQVSLGAWNDITGYVYPSSGGGPTGAAVTITRGRPDEATQPSPCSIGLQVTNTDATFSPHNPLGQFYGLFGRNTPLRVSIPAAASALRMEDDAVSSCSAPGIALPGFADVRIDLKLSHWGASVLASQWGTTAGDYGWAFLLNADGTLEFALSTDGTTITTATSTVPLPWPNGEVTLRATYSTSNGHVVFYYGTGGVSGNFTQLGATIDTPATGAIHTSTAALTIGASTYFASLPGYLGTLQAGPGAAWAPAAYTGMQGLVYELQLKSPSNAILADPQFTGVGEGTTSFGDAQGNTWTVTGTAEISGRDFRGHGEVSEWPPQWTSAATDAWTTVTASGYLRRLSQKNPPLPSAFTRGWQRITGVYAPVAYWPCEDGTQGTTVAGLTGTVPTQIASGLPGGRPMSIATMPGASGTSFAADSGFPSSNPIPVPNTSSWTGIVPHYQPPAGAPAVVRFLLDVPSGGDTDNNTTHRILTSGSIPELDVRYHSGGELQLVGWDAAGDNVFDSGNVTFNVNGAPGLVEVALTPNGSTCDWHINVLKFGATQQLGLSGTAPGSNTIGRVTAVIVNPKQNQMSSGTGQISVQDVYAPMDAASSADSLIGPLNGWAGETAAIRIARLSAEQGLRCRITGYPAASVAMGPQTPQTFLQLLQECENADHGLIAEPRTVLALGYRTGGSMAAQSIALTAPLVMDYAQGQIGSAGQQVGASDDDQLTLNDETVTRGSGNVTGSSFGAQLTTAAEAAASPALCISAPPVGAGDYQDQQTINVQLDSQLGDQAWWLVHMGTVNELRYPLIPLDLATTDPRMLALFTQIMGIDAGDYLQISNPPPFIGVDAIRQLAWGLNEQLGIKLLKLQWAARPASAWDVLTAGTGALTDCRYDTGGSSLATAATSGVTTLSVATQAGSQLWTTVAADCPFDILVAGERITVTAVTGTTSPQSFTVLRAVNSVSKAQAAGAPVSLFQPSYYALV